MGFFLILGIVLFNTQLEIISKFDDIFLKGKKLRCAIPTLGSEPAGPALSASQAQARLVLGSNSL